ncbi:glutathione S-transferase family protein [Hyphobacterium sp. CCMP332]|uniref:glutathione S-transferase family protein n=1 Tax=Hyphobacterium sp. CCMP332 TaxID=2749086 RepID=UPI00164F8229|nr:glutathione S-transferase family protein [Hyphobacterium sp. CCMP332]QNL18325.1 glutathione S-transferase family protein [Hyphobacterium sp. CCMP332]
MSNITLYGSSTSGNCLKTRWIADLMGVAYDWREMDVFAGDTRTEDFLALNPAGQVPCMVREDGRILAQSNAIMLYLAEGSALVPDDAFDRAKMMEWMFWEQYSHEPAIAVRRAQLKFMNVPEAEIDPMLMQKGRRALGVMELRLMARDFIVGEHFTLADVALVAYTRVAHEGGFDLADFPAVRSWVHRVERELGLEPAEYENIELA